MREQKTIVSGLDLGSLFQFLQIVRAIKSAVHPARMLVALCMVLVLLASGSIWDSISSVDATTLSSDQSQDELQQLRTIAIAQAATSLGHIAPEGSSYWTVIDAQHYLLAAWEDYVFEGDVAEKERLEFEQIYVNLERVRRRGPFEASASFLSLQWNTIVDAGTHANAVQMWQGVVAIVWELPQHLWRGGYHLFISLYGFLVVFVLCIGGGAIAQMEVRWHAHAERLSIAEAVRFSMHKWRELLCVVCGPAMVVATLAICLMVMGLVLLNIPWLNMVGGVLYGGSLLLGFFLSVIAVGYAACFPMLIPAMVVENETGSEAICRVFSYVFANMMRYIGYVFVLLVSLIIGYIIVRLIAMLTLDVTANLVGVGTFNNSLQGAGAPQNGAIPAVGLVWYESSAGYLIQLWETIVRDLMIGWLFSAFFTGSTMLYLLMRKAYDSQDTKDVCLCEADSSTEKIS
jgi:hypothetical protein